MAITDLTLQLGLPVWAMALLMIWALVWKGLAMWKASRSNHPVWFWVILVINTFGILEILYIFVFSKIGPTRKKR